MADDQKPDTPEPKKKRKMFKKPRFRSTYIWILGFLVLLLSLLTDPDTGLILQLPYGAGTVAVVMILARGILYAGLLHFTRKGLMDYFDLEEAWELAKETPQGVGLYVIGAGLYTIAMALVIFAATK
jgi:hypothetical protein